MYPLSSVILLAYVETTGQGEFEPNNTHVHNVIRQTSLHELNDRDWNTIMDRNS